MIKERKGGKVRDVENAKNVTNVRNRRNFITNFEVMLHHRVIVGLIRFLAPISLNYNNSTFY